MYATAGVRDTVRFLVRDRYARVFRNSRFNERIFGASEAEAAVAQFEEANVRHGEASAKDGEVLAEGTGVVARSDEGPPESDGSERVVAERLSDPDNRRPMIINTMPKSGSVYIRSMLEGGFSLSRAQIHNMYFPDDVVNIDNLREWATKNMVTQAHLSATELNLFLLGAFVRRMIIHVRDPREATLSWVHFVERLAREAPLELLRIPYVSQSHFLSMTFSERIDWAVERHLPLLVNWLNEWVAYAEQPKETQPFQVAFTTYEELLNDELELVAKISAFFDVPFARFKHRQIEKSEAVYFRKGDPNEWRSVFSETQRERATLLCGSVLTRFGWQ